MMSRKLHIYFALDHDEAKSLELCDSLWRQKPSPKRCFSMEHVHPVCIPRVPPGPGKAGPAHRAPTEALCREGGDSSQRLGNAARSRDLVKPSSGFPAPAVEQFFRKDPSGMRQAEGGSSCIILPVGKEPEVMLGSDFRESHIQALPRA
ncbi:unnamed protein product [Coccothraustes coccothraustes]